MFSCQYSICAIAFFLGGVLEQNLGLRIPLLCAGLLSTAGLLLSFLVVNYSFWLLFIFYGVMYPMALGIGYAVSLISVVKWIPKRTRLAFGVVMSGVGLGGLGFNILQTVFINTFDKRPDMAPYEDHPDEKYFSQTDVIERTPYMFLIEGVILLIAYLFSAVLMVYPYPSEVNHTDKKKKHMPMCKTFLKKLKVIILKKDFWILGIYIVLAVSVSSVIVSLYKVYGMTVVEVSDYFVTILGAVANGVFDISGRIVFGYLSDVLGYKMAFALENGLNVILISTLYISSFQIPWVFFVWTCGIFMCRGGYYTTANIACLESFGEENFSIAYGLMYAPSQVIGSLLSGVLSDYLVDPLGWDGLFMLLGCLSFIQFIIAFMLSGKTQKSDISYSI